MPRKEKRGRLDSAKIIADVYLSENSIHIAEVAPRVVTNPKIDIFFKQLYSFETPNSVAGHTTTKLEYVGQAA